MTTLGLRGEAPAGLMPMIPRTAAPPSLPVNAVLADLRKADPMILVDDISHIPGQQRVLLGAEQYRLLRTRMLAVARGGRGNTFAVASALSGDGKTVTTLNIAFSLARVKSIRTLLIELDLRRPNIAKMLGLKGGPHRRLNLESAEPWQNTVIHLRENLDALLVFDSVPRANEALQSPRLASMLQEASTQYDMVLIDTAPLLATVDTHSILPHVANVLFVVKAEHTKICDIQDSLDQLGDKTLGVILNKIRHLKHEQHYYSYQ